MPDKHSHTTPSQVKHAFLKCVYTATKSESLVAECTDLFDHKTHPEPVESGVLKLS